MDSRAIYSAAEKLGSMVVWDREWLHFGTGKEIDFDLIKSKISTHLQKRELFLVHQRTTSRRFNNDDLTQVAGPLLGIENFEIWNPEMNRAILFNKIGVMKLGELANENSIDFYDTAVFTTRFVIEDGNPITYVSYGEEDGAWQFFSGDPFLDFESVARIVGPKELIDLDPSIEDIVLNLEEGFFATRDFIGDKWKIQKISK